MPTSFQVTLPNAEQFDQMNAYLAAMASGDIQTISSDWKSVERILRTGYGSKLYNIGDELVENWIDTQANVTYEYPWRFNKFGDAELIDGETISGAFLQSKWAHSFGVQFSHQRAFLKCPDGLAVGTYYFTIESSWGTNVVAGDIVAFTTTVAVPAGGRVAGCYGAPDQAKSSWRIYTYSADGKTILETIVPTFEASGTSLGTLKTTQREGNLNCAQEMAYGSNRWKNSAIRQYLNSNAAIGAWWSPQDEFDIAPDQLTTKPGYLTGLPDDMISVMKAIKVTTYCNTVNDGGTADITYDNVFLPSLEQMYINPQIAGEGEYHDYWKRVGGRTSPYAQSLTYQELKHYAVENHASAQYVRLRSAYRGYAHNTWDVYSSGLVNYYNAYSACRFSPIIFI